ncbi:MAG: DUF1844 domain-containing protein [Planctomycetota bacterium]
MAEKPAEPNEEVPAFIVSEKKVDDSWKEEVRRERERAARGEAPSAPSGKPDTQAPPGGGPAAAQAQPGREAPRGKRAAQPQDQAAKMFITFLAGLAQQTLMQLGDIANPFSGQREVDLQGARYTIELLSVIQAKTKNNLTEEEENALTSSIGDLKMRFVEVANEVQRQMQAEAQRAATRGAARPGPGGTIPGPGFGKRR